MPLAVPDELRIAAIVPCYNEALAIAKVVTDLRANFPKADIYVYDNASTDDTARVARDAGAIVRSETTKGKGNVVRRAFADIDADIYLLIDGDDTYAVESMPAMVEALIDGPFDHILGVRQDNVESSAYRPGHSFGNRAFNTLVSRLFHEPVTDMLSGCRVFSRRFVKSFPALSREFEIETELTVHYASLRIPHLEMPVEFRDRAEGSESKLRTFRDGFKILGLLTHLVRHERPVAFHGLFAAILFLIGLGLGIPVIVEFVQTGLVAKFPSAILASSIVVLAGLVMLVGVVLEGITRSRHENERLVYLSYKPVR